MTRTRKLILALAVGAVVAVAVGASGAIAVSRALDDGTTEAVIADAAEQLGVEPEALSDALKEALRNQVDEAVESGRLSEEQGERLQELIESGEVPFLGLPRLERFGHGHVGVFATLDAAADFLELSEEQVRERLRDGETLAEIARDEGKSVDGLVDALVDAARARIDEAVEDGRLDEERAAELREGVQERVEDLVNGELRLRGDGPRFGHRFGPGFGFRDAPPLIGPRA